MCQNTTMRLYSTDQNILRFMFKTYSSSSSLVITSCWFATSRLRAPVSVRLVYCAVFPGLGRGARDFCAGSDFDTSRYFNVCNWITFISIAFIYSITGYHTNYYIVFRLGHNIAAECLRNNDNYWIMKPYKQLICITSILCNRRRGSAHS